jgi:hypothetical protein
VYLIWLWSEVGWFAEHLLNIALILVSVGGYYGAHKAHPMFVGLVREKVRVNL